MDWHVIRNFHSVVRTCFPLIMVSAATGAGEVPAVVVVVVEEARVGSSEIVVVREEGGEEAAVRIVAASAIKVGKESQCSSHCQQNAERIMKNVQ